MVPEQQFISLCHELGLGQFVTSLTNIALIATFGVEGKGQDPLTHIGGVPNPELTDWPMIDGERCLFLGQINCSYVPNCQIQELLPKAGVLQFFSNATGFLWEAPKLGNGRVVYQKAPEIHALAGKNGIELELKPGFTLNAHEPAELTEKPDWNVKDYFELQRRLVSPEKWLVQLGGHPDPVQDNMSQTLSDFASDDRWLMLGSFNGMTDEIGPFFGRYYFWITESHLTQGRFDQALMLFQA